MGGALYRMKLASGSGAEDAIGALTRNPNVVYAEPNYVVHALRTPDDLDARLWGLRNAHAEEAWETTTGEGGPLVAVIDSGIDYSHPDLAANIFTNPAEIPGDGIDNDNNGVVDDVHGADFANRDGDPMDDNSHGTHCAGTIGAVGDNGQGVVGVNWKAQLLPVKFLSDWGSGTFADAIESLGTRKRWVPGSLPTRGAAGATARPWWTRCRPRKRCIYSRPATTATTMIETRRFRRRTTWTISSPWRPRIQPTRSHISRITASPR